MYCSECGQRNPDEARFCAYCGARLLTAPLPEQATADDPEWDAESIFDQPAERRAESAPPESEDEARPRDDAGEDQSRQSVPEASAPVQRRVEAEVAPDDGAIQRIAAPGKRAARRAASEASQRAARPERRRNPAADAQRGAWERPAGAQAREEGERPAGRRPAKIVASHSATRAGEAARAEHAPQAEYSPWAKPEATDRALRAARSGAPSTIVPRRSGKPLEESTDLFFDEYDEEPEVARYDPIEEDERKEMRRLSYVERNLRGFIGVGLTLLTLLVLAAWLFLFPSGQMMLARFGLTDSATAYAGIARNAYDSQNYATAAKNYYQALLLDDDNYEYAISTADCYMKAGNTGSAATALTMAIQINASDKRAYQLLQQLYPDAQTRPTAVTELLSQGATLTGDASLTQ